MIELIIFAILIIVASLMRPMVGAMLAANAYLVGALESSQTQGDSTAGVLLPVCSFLVVAAMVVHRRAWRHYRIEALDLFVPAIAALAFGSATYSPLPDVTIAYSAKVLIGC